LGGGTLAKLKICAYNSTHSVDLILDSSALNRFHLWVFFSIQWCSISFYQQRHGFFHLGVTDDRTYHIPVS